MTNRMWHKAMMGAACVGALSGCVTPGASTENPTPVKYLGIETRLLDGDLVNFLVETQGGNGAADVDAYAKCAAAQYAVIRGFGFARHVRTNMNEEGGVWRGDAVYTISDALPGGLKTLDAEVVLADCIETGIPTV